MVNSSSFQPHTTFSPKRPSPIWSAVTNCLAAITGWISGACTVPNTVSRSRRCQQAGRPGNGLQRFALVVGVAAVALPAADRQHELDPHLVGQAREAQAVGPFAAPALRHHRHRAAGRAIRAEQPKLQRVAAVQREPLVLRRHHASPPRGSRSHGRGATIAGGVAITLRPKRSPPAVAGLTHRFRRPPPDWPRSLPDSAVLAAERPIVAHAVAHSPAGRASRMRQTLTPQRQAARLTAAKVRRPGTIQSLNALAGARTWILPNY